MSPLHNEKTSILVKFFFFLLAKHTSFVIIHVAWLPSVPVFLRQWMMVIPQNLTLMTSHKLQLDVESMAIIPEICCVWATIAMTLSST